MQLHEVRGFSVRHKLGLLCVWSLPCTASSQRARAARSLRAKWLNHSLPVGTLHPTRTTPQPVVLAAQCAWVIHTSAVCLAVCPCCSKLHLMQQQLWSDTYTADNVQALSVISQELQQEEQELTRHIEQVRV